MTILSPPQLDTTTANRPESFAAGCAALNRLGSSAPPITKPSTRQHILTIGLEDWFHVRSFQRFIRREQWYRFETRLERSVELTLDLLRQHDATATFFTLGWVAEHMPELLKRVVEAGHEVASAGYDHRNVTGLSREEFRADLTRTRAHIEAATGQRVFGYRIPDGWLNPADLWALEVLAEEGYAYDSSLLPMFRRFAGEPARRFMHAVETPAGKLIELPPATWRTCGLNIPVAGGNWLRQLPGPFLRRALRHWEAETPHPFVMYFHTWELDPEQPRVSAIDRLTRVRHYRNLDRMRQRIEEHLSHAAFGTVAAALGLSCRPIEARDRTSNGHAVAASIPASVAHEPALPVSIVIPCFNEEETLPSLNRTLDRVTRELAPDFLPQFVLVDDRSTDGTWSLMQTLMGSRPDCTLVRHEQNAGVSAAILTGIRHAQTERVCSMDCDCSYDPVEFKRMLPLLTDDVDLVTASPYHPQGHVQNVPGWRLLLSKTLSRMYRVVLPVRLHTWTSCCRVYRKSAVEKLTLREGGFLGTAELVGRLALGGSKIVEHPATLEVRIFGESKMKTLRTIRGHLRLIGQFVKERLRGTTP